MPTEGSYTQCRGGGVLTGSQGMGQNRGQVRRDEFPQPQRLLCVQWRGANGTFSKSYVLNIETIQNSRGSLSHLATQESLSLLISFLHI